MKKRFWLALACLVAAGIVVPVGSADPINAKNGTQVTAICSGHSIVVAVNGNGEFTPAHSSAAHRCSSRRRST
jgi:hypothetical protein